MTQLDFDLEICISSEPTKQNIAPACGAERQYCCKMLRALVAKCVERVQLFSVAKIDDPRDY